MTSDIQTDRLPVDGFCQKFDRNLQIMFKDHIPNFIPVALIVFELSCSFTDRRGKMQKLQGAINLPPPPKKFSKYNTFLVQATREVCEESMAEAVHEAVAENEGKRALAVAVDGSWQKRDFSSKNGLPVSTLVKAAKVLDVDKFSEHCICPNKANHLQKCKRNFEVDGALSIFRHSESKYNVRVYAILRRW
ncbi:hypothetical protein AVEN_245453-1 [Araneus ventricosus]|uniref:Mutator-like transposase domain-containing protein n=1 Tax=Araneus ventricosus TaxID=182803 RepID=A0A4Y2JKU8_ARAVE|nr:hypothetical protein AVEN_245453-1 [Araneus ventricosus]